jgi:maltose alpha-D-glucosyltransferase/alpha-amylase
MPKWLKDAVFYEIYPQSFLDANGDGIGDFEGIIRKLDYIKDLGCNALWLNPCFDSPFKDAGYDVRDYKKTAARYGTNDDLKRLFGEAHKRDMRALLDLVPGHTSEEHSWFLESKKADPAEAYRNRYIWADSWIYWGGSNLRFVAGEAERNGVYVINFFKCQPALNYGFLNPVESWQLPMDHPDSMATREALKDVMRFWLDAGCDGFRVDMADSLVKYDEPDKRGACAIWRDIRAMLDAGYPEAALVAEWSRPDLSLKNGFHMDFLLDHAGSGYKSLVRDYSVDGKGCVVGDASYFKRDSGGDITRFLDQYLPWYESTKNDGFISLISGNHDTFRISRGLSSRELALFYGLIFTLPGVPFIYYGDEIGMKYLDMPTKEGGYTRTGSRTPMQWTGGRNRGFSEAPAGELYLPVDSSPDAPTVEAQERDPLSLLNTVKALLRLRHAESDLQAAANLEVLYAKKGSRPAVYRRGSFVMGLTPSGETARVSGLRGVSSSGGGVFSIGSGGLDSGTCTLEPQSFVVWRV